MEFTIKNFRLNVIFRVIVIALLSFILAFVIVSTEWFFTPLFLSLVIIALVVNLIFYVEKTNKEITQFLYNIKQGGFNTMMSSAKTGSPLGQIFNEVIEEFKKVSIEKESHYQYLRTLNENIGISIISYKEDGEITLLNPAAKELLKKPYIKNISEIENIDSSLFNTISKMKSGQREVVKIFIEDKMIQLAVQLKKFILQEENFNVLLLQNIQFELEQKEIDAWQKLISVLTHEIMNSVTPIASLSTAINHQLVDEEHWMTLENDDREDILTSLKTIENRSKGLLRFVNAYKEFAKTPELNLSETDLVSLIERICNLLKPDIERANIHLIQNLKYKKLMLRIDHELVEQVIINIIKNAIEVLNEKDDSLLKISLERQGNMKVQLKLEDNGIGMDKETLDRIFIPFFTTKKRGTGIGLSFSRQIMKLHGGTISAHSEIGRGTSFLLEFNIR